MPTTRRRFFIGSFQAAAVLTMAPSVLRADADSRPSQMKDFFQAIADGELEVVRRLLDEAPQLLGRAGTDGRSPFAVSLLHRRLEIAELLRGRGYEPDLHESALALDWPRFESLARQAPHKVNQVHAIGGTAMHAAAAGGAGSSIWRVYAQGGTPNVVSPSSPTALQVALQFPDLEIAERSAAGLLSNGADPSAVGAGASPPLHLAASRGSLDIVAMLIRMGAVPDARDSRGRTAAQVAEESGHVAVARLLVDPRRIPRDHSTSRRAYGPDGKIYQAPDMSGISVLDQVDFVGAAHGRIDVLRQKLAQTPSLAHSVSTTTESAVEAGAHMGRRDIVDLLLEAGAVYALPTAVMCSDTKRVRELLAEDPKRVHERGAHDFPLLWYPVIGDTSVDMLDFLVRAGAEVEQQHHLGVTALHQAAGRGRLDMVAYLLEAGADPKRVGRKFGSGSRTPLQEAEERGHDAVAKLLRKHGA